MYVLGQNIIRRADSVQARHFCILLDTSKENEPQPPAARMEREASERNLHGYPHGMQ